MSSAAFLAGVNHTIHQGSPSKKDDDGCIIPAESASPEAILFPASAFNAEMTEMPQPSPTEN